MADFLLEIGVEEIPDWMIRSALSDLKSWFERVVQEHSLGSAVQSWVDATPRRLALGASGLVAWQADSEELVTGPPKSAGAGAAQGFAKKVGTRVDQLGSLTTEKGEYLSFKKQTRGRSSVEILAEFLPKVIAGINFPKTMYWTGKGGMRFIRPIRWMAALLDDAVVPFEMAGVQSSNTTRGHRILGSKERIPVTIASYEQALRDNGVILRAKERQSRIEAALGQDVEPDAALLETLVYLTEFPTPIRGAFDRAYLELPKEILTTVMRHHQRYFSVMQADGSLAPEFVAVTNAAGDPEGLIRQGHERVLRARFNDARFFWKVDQQKRLSSRLEDLAKVTFQAKLGSYKDKTHRVVALANQLAKAAGADQNTVDVAALLAKCDLTTDMVKEFTELQGVVGGLYAQAQGETEAVSIAIYDQYKPVSMEDSIPRSLEGQVVAIADKLDTLIECFRIGLTPTGSKDPFALRRAAQGIVKILFESRLPMDVMVLVSDQPALVEFLKDRIAHYLREIKSYPYDEVSAVMTPESKGLPDLAERLEAVHQIRPTEDFRAVAASVKRIKNILKQADFGKAEADPELFREQPESELFAALQTLRSKLAAATDYGAKLSFIASLRPQVDLFFDKILVNDPDTLIRQNRLALLSSFLAESSTIADFSEIVTQGAGAQN